MITNPDRMEAEYRDVTPFLSYAKKSSVKEVVPLLEKLAATGKKDLVIIADDVEGEALATFVVNKMRGGFNVLAVKAPGYGDRKKEILGDIAVMTGATVISEELGFKLETAELSMLGKVAKVIATKDKTIIAGGKGKKSDIDDAVNATKAAIEEGVVAGGGTALIKAAEAARGKMKKSNGDKSVSSRGFDAEYKVGWELLLKALEAPLRQIAINAGKDDGAVIVEKVRIAKGNAGYDAVKDEIVPDMLAAGIIDPVKVTRSGVERAASAAAILLTTEVAITDEPEKEKPAMPDMGY